MEFVLIIIGLAIALGGLYIKKPIAGLLGLSYGAGLGFLLALMMMSDADSPVGPIILILIVAAIVSFLSVTYDKLVMSISSFGSFFASIFLLMALIADSFPVIIIVALIGGIASVVFSFKFYDYAFVLSTALTGGVITSLGAAPLFDGRSLESYITRFFWTGQGIGLLLLITLIVCGVGIAVQYRKLKESI